MDPTDNTWDASEAPAHSASDLPQVMDLVSEMFRRVQDDFASFFLAGLIPMGVTIVGTLVGLVMVYGSMGLGMLPGINAGDDNLMIMGMMGAMTLSLAVFIIGLMAVVAPMQASLYRAVWRYLVDDEPLTVGSAFSTFTQDMGRVYLFNIVLMMGVLVGSLFCYVPALLVLLVLSFAAPAVYVHRLGVGDAISLSVRHATEHFSWHVGFWGIMFAMQLILQYIPILGTALLMTVVPLYTLLAYRHVFGDGDLPRGFGGVV